MRTRPAVDDGPRAAPEEELRPAAATRRSEAAVEAPAAEPRTAREPHPDRPQVSVIVPLYRSRKTLARCLEGLLRQDHPSYEVIAVDSSPDDACAEIVAGFPEVRYVRSHQRLLPHAARNRGAALARGELLVFTDPDVYPAPDWLRRLAELESRRGGVVVGALACHGERWLDRGIHWTKFSKWIPGGAAHEVDMAPTAGLLVPRSVFAAAGGFPGEYLLGDAAFSWELRQRGEVLLLEPTAVGAHHHVQGFAGFVRERFVRGILFSQLRLEWEGGGRGRRAGLAVASLLPLRLVSNLAHVARHAARARRLGELLRVSPLVVVGFAASLAGEAIGALRRPPAATEAAARAARSR